MWGVCVCVCVCVRVCVHVHVCVVPQQCLHLISSEVHIAEVNLQWHNIESCRGLWLCSYNKIIIIISCKGCGYMLNCQYPTMRSMKAFTGLLGN